MLVLHAPPGTLKSSWFVCFTNNKCNAIGNWVTVLLRKLEPGKNLTTSPRVSFQLHNTATVYKKSFCNLIYLQVLSRRKFIGEGTAISLCTYHLSEASFASLLPPSHPQVKLVRPTTTSKRCIEDLLYDACTDLKMESSKHDKKQVHFPTQKCGQAALYNRTHTPCSTSQFSCILCSLGVAGKYEKERNFLHKSSNIIQKKKRE